MTTTTELIERLRHGYPSKERIEAADLLEAQTKQIEALQADAELGRIAMRFVDRAGDVADCDPAERICAEFYKAMGDAVTAALKGNV